MIDGKTKAGIAGAAVFTILIGPRGIPLGKAIGESVHTYLTSRKPSNDNTDPKRDQRDAS